MNDESRIDRSVADMLLREFEARGAAIAARCESEVLRRARAGEPLAAASRDEIRRALQALDALGRETRLAIAAAVEATEQSIANSRAH